MVCMSVPCFTTVCITVCMAICTSVPCFTTVCIAPARKIHIFMASPTLCLLEPTLCICVFGFGIAHAWLILRTTSSMTVCSLVVSWNAIFQSCADGCGTSWPLVLAPKSLPPGPHEKITWIVGWLVSRQLQVNFQFVLILVSRRENKIRRNPSFELSWIWAVVPGSHAQQILWHGVVTTFLSPWT